MKPISVLCAVFLSILQNTTAVPLTKREAQIQQENAFDIGPLSGCKVPTAADLPICHKYINYPVPEVLLSEIVGNIQEKSVDGAKLTAEDLEESASSDQDKAIECGAIVEQLECYKRFPACVNETTKVSYVTEGCKTKLQTNCSSQFFDILRDLSCGTADFLAQEDDKSAAMPLDTCTKVSSTSYNYRYCSNLNGWSDVYLTPWMNISVLNTENDIESFAMFSNNPVCIALYTELKCGEVGRCWDQGTRMEINATQELCNAILNCVNSQQRMRLEQQLSCSTYPSMAVKLSTPATEITQPTMEPPSTNPTSAATVSRPPTTDEFVQTTAATKDNGPPTVYFPYPADRFNKSSGATSGSKSTFTTMLSLFLLVWVFAIVL